MAPKQEFAAPWGVVLKWTTSIVTALLVALPLIGLFCAAPDAPFIWYVSLMVLPLLVLLGSVFFVVRCYELSEGTLIVHRLGWTSKVMLQGLQDAEFDPDAMRGSIRLLGNGGMFCFAGLFRNKKLGIYRAFATDTKRAVVLRFSERTVVVTPDEPERFVAELKPLLSSGG